MIFGVRDLRCLNHLDLITDLSPRCFTLLISSSTKLKGYEDRQSKAKESLPRKKKIIATLKYSLSFASNLALTEGRFKGVSGHELGVHHPSNKIGYF